MVTDAFGALLQDLGKLLNLPDLHPDANNCCLIRFKGGLQVQLEKDRRDDALLVIVDFGQVPSGKYRENLFTEALKANGAPPPRYGIFAYSKQTDRFILFEKMELRELVGVHLTERFHPFIEKARVWKEAISRGDIPQIAISGAQKPKGIFGLQ